MLAQNLLIYPWLIIEALKISLRYEFYEILIPRIVLTKHDKVVWPAAGRITVVPASLGDIHFTADDRLHAGFVCGFVETDRAEQISVIGDRNCRHFIFDGGLCQC